LLEIFAFRGDFLILDIFFNF